MVEKRSWWQQINKHRVAIVVVAILMIIAIALIIIGYRFDWTGFNGNNKSGKTLWDWLQIIFVPAILTLGAVWFTARQNHDREIAEEQRKTDYELQSDNQREAILQSYFDKMSELLLHENLSTSKGHDVVANIAETRTLMALSHLDSLRKGNVIVFVAASGLIDRRGKIIDLNYADLRGANLRHISKLDGISLHGANLERADCSGSVLSNVSFQDANLKEAILFKTDLRGADFKNANLSDAILIGTNLGDAKITSEQLLQAKSLKGATMPDGSIHQ